MVYHLGCVIPACGMLQDFIESKVYGPPVPIPSVGFCAVARLFLTLFSVRCYYSIYVTLDDNQPTHNINRYFLRKGRKHISSLPYLNPHYAQTGIYDYSAAQLAEYCSLYIMLSSLVKLRHNEDMVILTVLRCVDSCFIALEVTFAEILVFPFEKRDLYWLRYTFQNLQNF